MSIEELKERQTQLVLQRSQAKDVVENCERELGAVNFAIQAVVANTPKDEEVVED